MRTVMIDDEAHCTLTLGIQLKKFFPDFSETVVFNDARKALVWLQQNPVDLVFLDVEMPHLDGFSLLKQLGAPNFQVILTTAFNKYILQAFKVEAVDYLLKPVDDQDFVEAVNRAQKRLFVQRENRALDDVVNRITRAIQSKDRIAIPNSEGVRFLFANEIIYCQSEGNYTRIALLGGKSFLATKVLKDVHAMLNHDHFIRIHNSYVVNAYHVVDYLKAKGGSLILTEGHHVLVSRSRKEELKKLL